MTLQFHADIRADRVQAIVRRVGPSPTLEIREGIKPAKLAAQDSGRVLASIRLPQEWMTGRGDGMLTMSGNWQTRSADATGQAGYFRIRDAAGVARIQGRIARADQDGEMEIDNESIRQGQSVTVTMFVLIDGNEE